MITHQELIVQKSHKFTIELFYSLYAWSNSLKEWIGEASTTDRKGFEVLLKNGFTMNISQFSLIVRSAYKNVLIGVEDTEPSEWKQIHLKDEFFVTFNSYKLLFEIMGSNLSIAEQPKASIKAQSDYSLLLFNYMLWWLLAAWPGSNISVSFQINREHIQIFFSDLSQNHQDRAQNEGFKVLDVWSCLVEYLIFGEYQGCCIWPKEGQPRRLEIRLPLRPLSSKELDMPLPTWIKTCLGE